MSLFYLVYICLVVALAGMPEHNQSFFESERPNIVWITTEDNSIDYLVVRERLYLPAAQSGQEWRGSLIFPPGT